MLATDSGILLQSVTPVKGQFLTTRKHLQGWGERIRRLRRDRDFTQEELARMTKRSRSAIATYESEEREPDWEGWIVLAKALSTKTDPITPGWLMFGDASSLREGRPDRG